MFPDWVVCFALCCVVLGCFMLDRDKVWLVTYGVAMWRVAYAAEYHATQ